VGLVIEELRPVPGISDDPEKFDLNRSGNALYYDVGPYEAVAVQSEEASIDDSGTYATAVLTLKKSLDRRDYRNLATTTTIAAGGGVANYDKSREVIPRLKVEVTTPEGATGYARITAWGLRAVST